MQTVLAILIYYGIGLNFGGYIGPSVFLLGLFVYVIQIINSTWWLRRFQYGPLEWIWRMLTYGKKLPLRKGG